MVHEDLSIISLILNASVVVQMILALLIFISIGSWSIIIRKGFALGAVRRATEAFERDFWSGGDLNTLLDNALRKNRIYANSLQRIFQAGMQEFLKAKEIDAARRAMKAAYQREMDSLEANLPFLASVGSVSPYIGLFGTVWGIMHALTDIGKSGSASLDIVAGPIGEALIATAIGIATALPAVLAYNLFLRRLRVHVTELENFAHDFIRLAAKHDFKV